MLDKVLDLFVDNEHRYHMYSIGSCGVYKLIVDTKIDRNTQ